MLISITTNDSTLCDITTTRLAITMRRGFHTKRIRAQQFTYSF